MSKFRKPRSDSRTPIFPSKTAATTAPEITSCIAHHHHDSRGLTNIKWLLTVTPLKRVHQCTRGSPRRRDPIRVYQQAAAARADGWPRWSAEAEPLAMCQLCQGWASSNTTETKRDRNKKEYVGKRRQLKRGCVILGLFCALVDSRRLETKTGEMVMWISPSAPRSNCFCCVIINRRHNTDLAAASGLCERGGN